MLKNLSLCISHERRLHISQHEMSASLRSVLGHALNGLRRTSKLRTSLFSVYLLDNTVQACYKQCRLPLPSDCSLLAMHIRGMQRCKLIKQPYPPVPLKTLLVWGEKTTSISTTSREASPMSCKKPGRITQKCAQALCHRKLAHSTEEDLALHFVLFIDSVPLVCDLVKIDICSLLGRQPSLLLPVIQCPPDLQHLLIGLHLGHLVLDCPDSGCVCQGILHSRK